jgi:hypothetical protein
MLSLIKNRARICVLYVDHNKRYNKSVTNERTKTPRIGPIDSAPVLTLTINPTVKE